MTDIDLNDFGANATVEKPYVLRQKVLQSPHTGKIAGFICRELNRPMKVYTSRRWRSHFYRNGNGYAISDSILKRCYQHQVSRVIIHDGDEEHSFTAWEFPLKQYRTDGKAVPDSVNDNPRSDPQTYVDIEDHLHEWRFTRDEDLYRWPFKRAMDRIQWKGYDPDLKDRIQAREA